MRCGASMLVLAAGLLQACSDPQANQARYEAYEECDFFVDQTSARPWVEGTVPRGHVAEVAAQEAMTVDEWPDAPPFSITLEQLRRGRERFEIFCSPCHGIAGDGNGLVARRGLVAPPPFDSDRLLAEPLKYFAFVAVHGKGIMAPHGRQVPLDDCWRIAAYIKALQLSAHAPLDELPADVRADVEEHLK